MIQGFKRCPINLRQLFLVPKDYNAKGIGLFLQGYCNLVKAVRQKPELAKELGEEKELIDLMQAIYKQTSTLKFMDNPEIFVESDKGKKLKDIKDFIKLLLASS